MTLDRLNRRAFLAGLAGLKFAPFARADTGHGFFEISVFITSVGPDSQDPSKTAMGVEITNFQQVDAVLRGIQTNYGPGQMHRTVSLLGTSTRSAMQFLAVNGGAVEILEPPERQITIDEPYSPDTYYALGFDFGPMGQVYAEWGSF